MHDSPLVSIVTPSLNQGGFLRSSIDSVLDQSYPRIEYLVMDGGSVDESLEVLRSHEGRLRWISEKDGGQAEAVNRGWREARGDVFGWLNADDVYEPETVRRAIEIFDTHPETDVVHADCLEVDEQGRALRSLRSWDVGLAELLLSEAWVYQPTVFVRRRVVECIGYLDVGLDLTMDFEYWLRAIQRCRFRHVPEVWARLRCHPRTKTRRRSRDVLKEHLQVLRRVFADPTLSPALRHLKKRCLGRAYLAAAFASFDAGHAQEGRERLRAAIRQLPHPLRLETLKAALLLLAASIGPAAPLVLRRLAAPLRPTPRWLGHFRGHAREAEDRDLARP